MTGPALIFSFLAATFLGAAFHFWKGGRGGTLLTWLILAWVGFGLGHMLGQLWDLRLLMIGPVYGGTGAAGSLVLLLLGSWVLSLDQT